MKDAMKQAIKEWMDEKYAELGKWSLGTIAVLGIAALAYFIMWANGWHR